MRRLLLKCPKDHQLIFAGDLVDRGPHSRQVVEFAMENEIPTVAGNHEHLALWEHKRVESDLYTNQGLWYANGGIAAAKSWGRADLTLPDDVLDWMEKLPMYLIYGDLLVSHTGHGLTKPRKGVMGIEESDDKKLWCRDTHFPKDGYYRVFGHSLTREPIITDTWANIDTGAAYGHKNFGTMTALLWPSKEVIQQRYDETPL